MQKNKELHRMLRNYLTKGKSSKRTNSQDVSVLRPESDPTIQTLDEVVNTVNCNMPFRQPLQDLKLPKQHLMNIQEPQNQNHPHEEG